MSRFIFAAVAIIAAAIVLAFALPRPGSGPAASRVAASGTAAGGACAPGGTQGMTDASVTELKIDELQEGNGREAKAGDTVSVHYTGRLLDGTEFDSSRTRGQPIVFPLGQGQVIPGWDQGLVGMKVGGRRCLTIPARLAYGEAGAGGVIPPNAALVFDVELVGIQ